MTAPDTPTRTPEPLGRENTPAQKRAALVWLVGVANGIVGASSDHATVVDREVRRLRAEVAALRADIQRIAYGSVRLNNFSQWVHGTTGQPRMLLDEALEDARRAARQAGAL